jgi:hypothetical protein
MDSRWFQITVMYVRVTSNRDLRWISTAYNNSCLIPLPYGELEFIAF